MPWSGGTFSRSYDWTTDEAGSFPNIEADRMDGEDDNFASGIDACLHKAGQNTPTADLPMGGQNHTGVGNATALDEYASATDVINQNLTYYVDTGSASAYVITPSPAISAYAEGQKFTFRATNTNSAGATLNVNAKGATAIETPDGNAITAGMIVSGSYAEVVYDANGSRFVMMSPVATGFAYNFSGLTEIVGNDLAAGDFFLVDDGANGTNKVVRQDSMGLRTQSSQTTQTLASADMNSIMQFTGTATLTIPANAADAIPVGTKVIVYVKHATQTLTVTVGATVTLVSVHNPGGAQSTSDTVSAGGTATLYKQNLNEWLLTGDIAD